MHISQFWRVRMICGVLTTTYTNTRLVSRTLVRLKVKPMSERKTTVVSATPSRKAGRDEKVGKSYILSARIEVRANARTHITPARPAQYTRAAATSPNRLLHSIPSSLSSSSAHPFPTLPATCTTSRVLIPSSKVNSGLTRRSIDA